jgi:hypothetical protein
VDEFITEMSRNVLGLMFLAAIPLVAIGYAIRDRLIRKRAESWSQAQARIESGAVSGMRGTFYATLAYSYTANGEWYSGSLMKSFASPEKAQDFIDDNTGKSIVIRYDPNRPETSATWQ